MKIIISLTVTNQLFILEKIFTWKFQSVLGSRGPVFQRERRENYDDFFHQLILACVESQVTTVIKRQTSSPDFPEKKKQKFSAQETEMTRYSERSMSTMCSDS